MAGGAWGRLLRHDSLSPSAPTPQHTGDYNAAHKYVRTKNANVQEAGPGGPQGTPTGSFPAAPTVVGYTLQAPTLSPAGPPPRPAQPLPTASMLHRSQGKAGKPSTAATATTATAPPQHHRQWSQPPPPPPPQAAGRALPHPGPSAAPTPVATIPNATHQPTRVGCRSRQRSTTTLMSLQLPSLCVAAGEREKLFERWRCAACPPSHWATRVQPWAVSTVPSCLCAGVWFVYGAVRAQLFTAFLRPLVNEAPRLQWR